MTYWQGYGTTVTLYPTSGNITGIITSETLTVSSKVDDTHMIQQMSFQREREKKREKETDNVYACVYLCIYTKRHIEEPFIAALL